MVLSLKDTADFPIPTKDIIDSDEIFNYDTHDAINAYDRTYLDIINANRTKFFPYGKVLIERSTDSGSTWTTVDTSGFSNENRGKLMSDIGASLYIGTGNAALTQQLRVTLQFPGTAYYCSVDRAFFRFSNSGHNCTVSIEASTYGAQSTYTSLAADKVIAGWSGNNMVKFTEKRAWGTNNSSHLYNIRFIFKYASVNSSYVSNQANIQKIDMFGQNFWGTSNSPQHYGHLYSWDYLKNVTFPANVTASAFLGNATSATYLLGNGRIASADISHIYTGNKAHQRFDIVSSTLTTGRPAGDGYLTTYMWDNAGTYDAQFYMPNGSTTNSGRPQVRYRPDGGSWTAWESLAKLSDVPTVNNGTLTIQKNGTDVQTFTANQSTNVTANITVPTSFSDLTGTIGTSQIDDGAVTDAKMDWSTLCAPVAETVTTSMGATYTKFYQCNNSIRPVFGGHGVIFSGFLDFGGSSGSATVNKTAVPGLTGYYGYKTNSTVPIVPNSTMLYSSTGFSIKYTPGGDPGSRWFTGHLHTGLAIATDGYIYIGVTTDSSDGIGSWERHQFRYPSGFYMIDH